MQNVLTIAGSDSLAGGGLQADLKTFEELDVFGLSAITSVANIFPDKVNITPIAPQVLQQQLDSILSQLPIQAIKTGLIGNVESIDIICQRLKDVAADLVVDPVLVLKEGSMGKKNDYLTKIKKELLSMASLTTPNLTEAEQLSDIKITGISEMRLAAQRIQQLGCPNVVIKGGNRLAGETAVDYLLAQDKEFIFKAPKIYSHNTNGAGCTFSAAITAYLALNKPVNQAVELAKDFVHQGIIDGIKISDDSGSVYQGAMRKQGGSNADE